MTIPHNFEPRAYQRAFLAAADRGVKRGVCVWHRRAGKDKVFLNFIVKKALQRVGAYYYIFPTYSQGRKALWDGLDRDGFKYMDHIPRQLRKKVRNDEMKVELVNSSIIQFVGSDNIDAIMGTNPVGCVFSEFSLQNPKAWDFIRPILAENDGFAYFNGTPRGMNHLHTLYQMALGNPAWFCELLTVDDTGAISQEAIQAERDAGMSEEMIQQEFYCSFEYGLEGAYYLKYINKTRQDGRIGRVPHDPGLPVHTFWDLGVGDATSIWFAQIVGQEIRLIDFYECQGEGLPHYAKVLQDRGYFYGEHWAPHDIAVRELGTGQSRIERARQLGLNFLIAKKLPFDDGIEAVRGIFHRCWFDAEKCKDGINALMNYQKEYNEKRDTYSDKPVHDWASHAADAFRYMAVSINAVGANAAAMTQAKYNEMRQRYGPPGVVA